MRRRSISDVEWHQFQCDGYLMLGSIVQRQLLKRLGAMINHDPQRKIQRSMHRIRFAKAAATTAIAKDACLMAYGKVEISAFRIMLMSKFPGDGILEWHQDKWDSVTGGTPQVTIWTAIDEANRRNGCVKVIPGSHAISGYKHQGRAGFLSERLARKLKLDRRCRHLELPAGHSVLLNNLLLHGSGPNRTEFPRRALSVCYVPSTFRFRGKRMPRLWG